MRLRPPRRHNLDAEREAANVRLRAERRVGELLKDLARATPEEAGAQGGRGNTKSASPEATSFQPSISEQAMPKGPSPYAAANTAIAAPSPVSALLEQVAPAAGDGRGEHAFKCCIGIFPGG